MGRFAAIVNAAYVIAGVALFATGEAPVVQPAVDFLGNKWAMAWAGWKFSGCLYMALVNGGVNLRMSLAIAMVPFIFFDVFASFYHPEHWTSLSFTFIALEAFAAVAALRGHLMVGGVINALYVVAGIALFMTGEAPVVQKSVDFYSDTFSMAWAGWKFSGCLYTALVNLGVHVELATAIAMVPYVACDIFAVMDVANWTPLAYGFIVLDGLMGVLGVSAWLKSGSSGGMKKA